MWDRKEVKLFGKARFKANYWKSVLCAFLISLAAGGGASAGFGSLSSSGTDVEYETDGDIVYGAEQSFSTMPEEDKAVAAAILFGVIAVVCIILAVGFIIKLFLLNPLQVGCCGFFRENAGGTNADMNVITSGFNNYGHTIATMLLRDVFLLLWTLLFIIPGLIKVYSYRMVPFILRDNPQLSATEVITASRKMMDGHKWNIFIFDLSYIGWYLLGLITLGLVDLFWTNPYRENANAAIYLKLIGEDCADPVAEPDMPVYPVSSEPEVEPEEEVKLELEPSPEPETELDPEPEIKLELDSTLEPEAPVGDTPAEPETTVKPEADAEME